MSDIITFIFEPHEGVNITTTAVTPSTSTDSTESSRYTYWDTREYPSASNPTGLLPSGGLMITIRSDKTVVFNPNIDLTISGISLKGNGTAGKAFNYQRKSFIPEIFDQVKTSQKITQNIKNGDYYNFFKFLTRVRFNAAYYYKIHSNIFYESDDSTKIVFYKPPSIDFYNHSITTYNYTNNITLTITKELPRIFKYLDLGLMSNFTLNTLNPASTILFVVPVETYTISDMRTKYEENYNNYLVPIGGIPNNEFYIRFGEPAALDSNNNAIGAKAVNCFVSGTMIKTDQGEIPIEKVSRKNTINKIKVYCVLTSTLKDKNDYYVLVKKDAFGKNRPNKDTISTKWHGVYLKDEDTEFVRLKNLVDGKNIIKKQVVKPLGFYNICLKDVHGYMYANNLKVETLLPTETILPVYGD